MKNLFSGKTFLVLGAVAAIGVAVWYIAAGDARPTGKTGKDGSIVVSGKKPGKAKPGVLKKLNRPRRQKPGEKATPPVRPPRPDFTEEVKLSGEMRKMLLDLQNALDIEDKKKVFALVHKLQLMDEWPDGIPKAVKLKALQALSWFGAVGMAEAVRFLEDSDQDIVKASFSTFENMLNDSWNLGDKCLAQTLTTIASANIVRFDSAELGEFYTSIFASSFLNMRDSVKAQTVLDILSMGSPKAVEVIKSEWKMLLDVEAENVDPKKPIATEIAKILKDAQASEKGREKELDEEFGAWNW